MVTYREYVTHNVEPKILAREIAERSVAGRAGGGRESIREIFLSPDAYAHHSSPDTIADQLGQVLFEYGLPQPARADDDRVGGWMLMYQMLREGNWVIADGCHHLIECLPTLVRDPVNVEDVRKMEGDDPADAARYGLKSRLGAAAPPVEQRVAERISAVDPTSRAIWMRKLMREEQRAAKPPVLPHRHGLQRW